MVLLNTLNGIPCSEWQIFFFVIVSSHKGNLASFFLHLTFSFCSIWSLINQPSMQSVKGLRIFSATTGKLLCIAGWGSTDKVYEIFESCCAVGQKGKLAKDSNECVGIASSMNGAKMPFWYCFPFLYKSRCFKYSNILKRVWWLSWAMNTLKRSHWCTLGRATQLSCAGLDRNSWIHDYWFCSLRDLVVWLETRWASVFVIGVNYYHLFMTHNGPFSPRSEFG